MFAARAMFAAPAPTLFSPLKTTRPSENQCRAQTFNTANTAMLMPLDMYGCEDVAEDNPFELEHGALEQHYDTRNTAADSMDILRHGDDIHDSQIRVAVVSHDEDCGQNAIVPAHYAGINMRLSLNECSPFGPSTFQCDSMIVKVVSEIKDPNWYTHFPAELERQAKRASWCTNADCALLTGQPPDAMGEPHPSTQAHRFMANPLKNLRNCSIKPGGTYPCVLKIDGHITTGRLPSDMILALCIAERLLAPNSLTDTDTWPSWTSMVMRKTITDIFAPLGSFLVAPIAVAGVAVDASMSIFPINKLVRLSSSLETTNKQLCSLIQKIAVVDVSNPNSGRFRCECGAAIESDSTDLFEITVRDRISRIGANASTRRVHVCPHLAEATQERGYLYFETVREVGASKGFNVTPKDQMAVFEQNEFEQRFDMPLDPVAVIVQMPVVLPAAAGKRKRKRGRPRGSMNRKGKIGTRTRGRARKRQKVLSADDMVGVCAAYDAIMRRMAESE